MTRSRDIADQQENLGGAVAPFVSGKNGIINGGFDVSQRGNTITGIAVDNTYTADRWYVTRGGNLDYALKTVSGGNNPPVGFNSYGQYLNKTATNPFIAVLQTLETTDSIRFAGKTVTLSFYARATANTTKSKSLIADIGYNTTADTKSNTYVGSTTFTIAFGTAATDWTYCTLTASIPSNAKTVGSRTYQAPAGGLAVDDGFEITGVQLEIGSVATPFARAGGSIGGELALCQRYYEKSYNLSIAPGTNSAAGAIYLTQSSDGSNNSAYAIRFKVEKRNATWSAAAYAINGTATVWAYARNGVGSTNATLIFDQQSSSGTRVYLSIGAAWTANTIEGHWVVDNEL